MVDVTRDGSLSILEESLKGADVVCLLKVYNTYFVRKITGKEGVVENLYKTEEVKEAQTFFKNYIEK